MAGTPRPRLPRRLVLVGAAALALVVLVPLTPDGSSLLGFLRPAAAPEEVPEPPPAVECDPGDLEVHVESILAWPPAADGPATPEDALAAGFAADPTLPDPALLARRSATAAAVRLERLDRGRRVQEVLVEPYGNHWVVTAWAACASTIRGARS